MTLTAARTIPDLDSIILKSGLHISFEEGACLLELVSYLSGAPFSDSPPCVCPVLAAFGRRWNDDLGDTERQRLKRFAPLLIGTKSTPEIEDKRAWMATDWLVRVHTPAWLRLSGLEEQAITLETLPPILSPDVARAQQSHIADARRKAAAACAAACGAACGAACDAACGAACDAARDAACGVLEPTKLSLIASAEDLFERMIACR